MKATLSAPLGKENLDQLWGEANDLYGTARHRAYLCRFAGFFGHLALLPCALFFGSGMLAEHRPGPYTQLLEKHTWFTDSWTHVRQLLRLSEHPWYQQTLILLAVTAALCLGVFWLFSLPVELLRHKGWTMPDNRTEACNRLVEIVREARMYSLQTGKKGSLGATLLSCLCVSGAAAVLLVDFGGSDFAARLTALFPGFAIFGDPYADSLVILLLVLLSYALLDIMLGAVLRMFYRFRIPYEAVTNAEQYQLILQLESSVLSEEEVKERKAAYGVEKRLKAVEHERKGEYDQARESFLGGALAGDAPAMKHYARYCLRSREEEQAIFWLESYTSLKPDDKKARKALRLLQNGNSADPQMLQ